MEVVTCFQYRVTPLTVPPTCDSSREVDWFSLISVVALLIFAPFIVFYFVMACDQFQCSVSEPLLQLYRGDVTLLSIWARAPSFSWSAAKIYAVWVGFQVRREGRMGAVAGSMF